MSFGEKYGARVLSDLPQRLLDEVLDKLKKPIIDAMANVEGYDFAVDRIDIFRSHGTKIRIEAFPHKMYIGHCPSKPEEAHVCPECDSVYDFSQEHPDNECKLGVVEIVMES
jgi:hypothetical protein